MATPRVLVVGIDGVRPDLLPLLDTPHLDGPAIPAGAAAPEPRHADVAAHVHAALGITPDPHWTLDGRPFPALTPQTVRRSRNPAVAPPPGAAAGRRDGSRPDSPGDTARTRREADLRLTGLSTARLRLVSGLSHLVTISA
ncbi:hypothetical protein [Kitasatospora sp. NPDC056181]|uniref:hypothetical protein n=1 Tax=Kitasatospora sp. NPDC056181 TaxID=3345737 RepID=UPI0035D7BD06